MKAGISTIALRKYDVLQAIDLAADAGFAGVEIWGRAPHTPDDFDADHTLKIRDRLRAKKLGVSMVGSYVNPSSPDYVQRAADSLKIARILGARIIRVWAGNREPQDADEQLWAHVAKLFHDYALQAEDQGVTLAMEMHGGTLCLTPEGSLRVIEESRAPNLKLNFQVSDARNPDLERVIGMVGDYVVNVHAQNHRPSRVEPEKMELCLVEEGLIDYDTALSLLKGHGFDGYVEVEFLKGEFGGDEIMLDSLKRDGAYLKALTAKYSS